MIIDADQFWDVNNTFGHKSDDEALRMVGQCLTDGLRYEAVRKGNGD